MIIFKKTVPETRPAAPDAETSRVETGRKTAAERRAASDADGARRRGRPAAEDDEGA